MKIAHMIDSTHLGGAERMAINLVNSLSKIPGNEVVLIVSRSEGQGSNYVEAGVRVLKLGKRSRTDRNAFASLWKLLKSERFDVVHAHTNSIYWLLLLKFSLLPNLKLVWHDHFGNRPASGKWFNRSWNLLSGGLSAYIGISQPVMAWASRVLRTGKHRQFMLPNFPALGPVTEAGKQPFLLQAGSPTLLLLGNFREEKDHFTLVEAFQQLVQRYPGARLWLAGKTMDSEYRQRVFESIASKQLTHQVVDWGEVADVANLIASADIGVFSSRFEGLPVSLLEFGLLGKPVVATAVGEIPEVLGHGQWGKLVPPGDSHLLGLALLELWENKSLMNKYSDDFATFARSRFDPEKVTAQLQHIYLAIEK
jgi:glycosyltransferase involved in cell wall biosynthesis